MASPTKKRKKNPPSMPHKGKTLDHFFRKKSSPASLIPNGNGGELDDEEYARKLAKLWGEEDHNGGTVKAESSAGAGTKRWRSSSQEGSDFKPKRVTAADATHGEGPSPDMPVSINTNNQTKQNSPRKNEVSIQAEEETHRTIDSITLDSDPLSFNPDDYLSLANSWPDGKATYGLLTRAFVLVNRTRSRIKIVDTLVNLLRILIRADPSSLLPAV